MPYPALPDMRMNWDNDGTLVYGNTGGLAATTAADGAQKLFAQNNLTNQGGGLPGGFSNWVYLFFPEQREVTAVFILGLFASQYAPPKGSNDTTNGLDGTWEVSSMPGGQPTYTDGDSWRDTIKPISFTGPKKNIRFDSTDGQSRNCVALHLYGEAAAGQMAHDLVFIDHDTTPGTPFTAPEDFGDQPLGTTVVRQFRVKNTSGTRTATNLNIQCNDADFTIGESAAGPWVVTINLASLLPGAESPTYYVRCTTPAVGAPLGPRFARIIVTCDSGFFG